MLTLTWEKQVFLVHNMMNSSLPEASSPQRNEHLRAMKVMVSDDMALNELVILMRLDHENVIKYYDHFEVNVWKIIPFFEIDLQLCVITEYCEVGSIIQFILGSIFSLFLVFKLARRFRNENKRPQKFKNTVFQRGRLQMDL